MKFSPISGLAAAVSSVLVGCTTLPAPMRGAPAEAGVSAPSTQAVAQRVQVTGVKGRLPARERAAMLARVAAQGGGDALKGQLLAMARFGEVDLYANNDAKLLVDGPATFASMFEAVEQARSTILLQSYIIEDSDIARRMAETLQRKRAQGVQVFVLYDAVGSIGTSDAYFDRLRAAGISTCAINPLNPLQRAGYWNITERDHRKILSVDRQIAYTGGINISGVYSSGSFGRERRGDDARKAGWRDTQLRVHGPAAAALDELIRAKWRDQGCAGDLPTLPPVDTKVSGQQLMRIVPTVPNEPFSRIYALLLNAIDASTRSVYLTMAYFAPGAEMIDALCDAAQRGVDVRLILPSVSDFTPVLHAGRHQYARLLDAGVKVYELQDAVLHAKTAVIDGVLSTVGSSNMDWRSFSSNSEVNAVVLGEDFGDSMVRMFHQDRANSTAIEAAQWGQRSFAQRTKEFLASLFERLW